MESINLISGVFLLILAICGNFVAETLGCKTQKLLSENMLAKNIINILVIYFAISFTSKNKKYSPLNIFIKSLLIWFIFLIFTKMNIVFTLIAFLLLIILLLLKDYIEYYNYYLNNEKEEDKKKELMNKIDILYLIIKILIIIIFIIILIGFTLYFLKQYKEHSKNFSYIIFLFGKNKCNSL